MVRLDYGMTWMKSKIDSKKLAKLRESGMSLRQIEHGSGVSTTSMWRKVKRFKGKY